MSESKYKVKGRSIYLTNLQFNKTPNSIGIGCFTLWVKELILSIQDQSFHSWEYCQTILWEEERISTKSVCSTEINACDKKDHITRSKNDLGRPIMHHCKMNMERLLKYIMLIDLQDIHNDTQRPHVTWSVIFLWTKNIWSCHRVQINDLTLE